MNIMKDMRLNLFKTFVRVVEIQNLSRVAEEMGISQPAVSKQIQSLEETFGVLLLERAGRRLKPTEAGEVLYECSMDILRVWERTEKIMEEMADTHRGNLLLGASTIPGEYIMPTLLKDYKEKHPQVNIFMDIGDTEDIISGVTEGELDVGIVGAPFDHRRLDGFEWIEDELVLVVPEEHELSAGGKVSVNALMHEYWLFREKGSGTRQTAEEVLRHLGVKTEQLSIAAELGSTEAVLSSVEAGLGVSLVSVWAVNRAQKAGRLKSLRISGADFSRRFYVIFPRQKQRRRTVEAFLNFLRQVKEERASI